MTLDRPNHQPLKGPDGSEQWWVVYPWIDGSSYGGTDTQITTAGDLLGRMHAAPVDASGLRLYRWPEPDPTVIAGELAALDAIFSARAGAEASGCITAVRNVADRWPDAVAALRSGKLPSTGVSSDFKAANLVWTARGPVLVDPDNAGREPRLLDLALALILFHNESAGAPGRLFTVREWQLFLGAYLANVTLTEDERRLWPQAIDHMLWDEGNWTLNDSDDTAWANERQAAFLLCLAQFRPDQYTLDRTACIETAP
jgi:spectinomycin phosphotransferase